MEAESGDPNRDRAEQGDEAEAERDQRETPAERRGDATGRLGEWPFEIGLWVGKAGTPNHLGEKGDGRSDSARAKVSQYKNNPRGRPTPIPMESCPWCGEDFTPDSIALLPNAQMPADLRIACANWQCELSGDHPLPIVAVDEPLYRRLPAFLIATVDKFASLPWVGVSGALLGGADRYDATGFYGAAAPRQGNRLVRPLPPPDLVIQDELHLISGPLGTMAGLYETVIESPCAQEIGGQRVPLAAQARLGNIPLAAQARLGNIPLAAQARLGNIPLAAQARLVRPKIVASTATVRHAREQIQALFARSITPVFPPPGPERRDTWFARTMPATEKHARRYFGVAAQGRNPKEAMRRVLLALMGAATWSNRSCAASAAGRGPCTRRSTSRAFRWECVGARGRGWDAMRRPRTALPDPSSCPRKRYGRKSANTANPWAGASSSS